VALLAAAVFTVAWRTGRVHGAWFRWTGRETAFYQAMFRGTKNGDTRESLEALIGPGKTLDPKGQATYARIMKKWDDEKHPDCPDGYREGDVFVQHKTGGYYSCFQYRNGRLVNHDPAPFENMQTYSTLGK
jgi:hypothetical protein